MAAAFSRARATDFPEWRATVVVKAQRQVARRMTPVTLPDSLMRRAAFLVVHRAGSSRLRVGRDLPIPGQ